MRRVIVFTIIASFLFAAGCSTKFAKVEPKPDTSTLYVMRKEVFYSKSSCAQVLHVIINGVDLTQLNDCSTYVAIHLKPGTYKLQLDPYDKEGNKKESELSTGFSVDMKPGESYYVFTKLAPLGWVGGKKLDSGKYWKNIPSDSQGEIDATGKVQPRQSE